MIVYIDNSLSLSHFNLSDNITLQYQRAGVMMEPEILVGKHSSIGSYNLYIRAHFIAVGVEKCVLSSS